MPTGDGDDLEQVAERVAVRRRAGGRTGGTRVRSEHEQRRDAYGLKGGGAAAISA